MNKINGGVDVLTRPNGQDARPTEWVINIVQLLTSNRLCWRVDLVRESLLRTILLLTIVPAYEIQIQGFMQVIIRLEIHNSPLVLDSILETIRLRRMAMLERN